MPAYHSAGEGLSSLPVASLSVIVIDDSRMHSRLAKINDQSNLCAHFVRMVCVWFLLLKALRVLTHYSKCLL